MRKQTPVLDKKEKDVSDYWINVLNCTGPSPAQDAILYLEPNCPISIFFSFEEMSLCSVMKAPLISV